jgi:hypothetical protein
MLIVPGAPGAPGHRGPATEAPGATAPIQYPAGSRGPAEGDALVAREGYVRSTGYVWRNPRL